MLLHEQHGLKAQWLHIFPTLRCNMRCRFCSVSMDGKVSADFGAQFTEIRAADWRRIFFRTRRDVLFGGGEPFLHPEIIDILLGIPSQRRVTLFSNGTITDDQIGGIAEWMQQAAAAGGIAVLDLAYHPPMEEDRFLDRIVRLRGAGVRFAVSAVRDESTLRRVRRFRRRLREAGFSLRIRDDAFSRMSQVARLAEPQEVFCRRRHLVIAPDGRRYPCIRHMLAQAAPMEDMIEGDLQPLDWTHRCQDYGTCTVCDLERFCKIATTEKEVAGPVERKDFRDGAQRSGAAD